MVRDAWTEPGVTKFRCGGCLQLFNTENELSEHQQTKIMNGDYSCASSSTVTISTPTYHPAEYETRTVVDKEAYDETVVTGYKCTICGATKITSQQSGADQLLFFDVMRGVLERFEQ